MLSVEQVRALEERVEKAVSYIESLKTENAELRRELERVAVELGAAKAQSAELEAAAQSFKNDQARIEAGIVHALEKLDMFEDLVLQVGETRREAAVQPEPVVQTAAQFSLKPAESAFGQESPSAQPEAKAAEEMSEAELEAATAPAKGEENELDIF